MKIKKTTSVGEKEVLWESQNGFKSEKFPYLIDKMIDRIAYEKMGVRIYDALKRKVSVSKERDTPKLGDIEAIRDEALDHFAMLNDHIKKLSGDPNEERPFIELDGIELLHVLSNPQNNTPQCLSTLLTTELIDYEGWYLLIELAESLGFKKMASDFQSALEEEEDHLAQIRTWLSENVFVKQ